MNNKQKEVIEGCLLGDGCVYIPHKNAVFQYATVEREHLNFVKKLLEERNINFNTSTYEGYRTHYSLTTTVYSDLTKMRKEWYVEKEKGKKRIIPEDLEGVFLMKKDKSEAVRNMVNAVRNL